ncbi:MAG: MFS transporter, partial [Fischerella sp.]|nr:MFS transporter [Fischerella sp.]
VLMSAAIPRAVLMLFGGVVSDRFSPRLVMFVSNALRGLLIVLFATIVALKMTQLWHIYFFAASFGIFDGFFIPASKSIIPSLVSKEQLIASNTLSQGTSQLILLIGPALGGLLIATAGIEVAFVIDGITFAITTITLLLMKGTTAKAGISREHPNFVYRFITNSTISPPIPANPKTHRLSLYHLHFWFYRNTQRCDDYS